MRDSDVKKIADKLHRQFAHPTAEKLKDLIKKASVRKPGLIEAIDDVSKSCEVCLRFKKAAPRPVVSMPIASKFNDVIAMDLKSWGSKYFLVIIDVATRYLTATVIENKHAITIINGVFLSWIAIFGTPRKILSDNGCEFNNSEMRDLGERFNIKILTTAAESPWSNGVCERQNAVLGEGVRKIMDDTNCSLNIALAWTVSARNSLSNHSGFSPNQLVFGQNPSLPNVYVNKPPALECTSSSEIVRNNLNAMHAARQEFVKFESDEKLKRALRHNVRDSHASEISSGDEVFYKRNDSKEWRGPGIVIGRDGKQFIVKHGGTCVRVHACRLTSAPVSLVDAPSITEEQQSSTDSNDGRTTSARQNFDHRNVFGEDLDEEQAVYLPQEENITLEEENPAAISDSVEVRDRVSEVDGETIKFKVGQRIRGVASDTGEMLTGKILSRAGKSTGKYKNWFNVEKDDGTIQSIDLQQGLQNVEEISEDTELLVFFSSTEVMSAKEKEIESWKGNSVYEEVENVGQTAISTRWVVTEKLRDGEPVLKARLVARGFEENTEELTKYSPTCSKEAVRLAISIASSEGWECHTIDVKSAYLQGNPIDRDVYLKPPPEFNCGTLWKLNKTVYGLSDAARQWFLRVTDELKHLGMKTSSLDSALFSWNHSGGLQGVICLYVDDFLWAGTQIFKNMIVDKLSDMFLIGSSASKAFKYIGLNICANNGYTTVDQFEYAQTIKPVTLSRQRAAAKSSELSDAEKTEYRGLIGQLNWISTHTRPDIAFDVCELSVICKNATIADLLRLNKVVLRVKNDNMRIFFPKLEQMNQCTIECYADASFANLTGSASQGGCVIFIKDSTGNYCPIYWQSKKIRRVVKSTLAAETLALVDCASAAIYIRHIIEELTEPGELPINLYTDNKSLLDTLSSAKSVDDRRLRIDIAVLQDMIQKKEIRTVSWVDSAHQLANCLTKRGASAEHLRAVISRD